MFRILYSFIVVIGDTTVLNRFSLETELRGQVGMQGNFCSSSVKRQWDSGLGDRAGVSGEKNHWMNLRKNAGKMVNWRLFRYAVEGEKEKNPCRKHNCKSLE